MPPCNNTIPVVFGGLPLRVRAHMGPGVTIRATGFVRQKHTFFGP